jgi:hypothetical protein
MAPVGVFVTVLFTARIEVPAGAGEVGRRAAADCVHVNRVRAGRQFRERSVDVPSFARLHRERASDGKPSFAYDSGEG